MRIHGLAMHVTAISTMVLNGWIWNDLLFECGALTFDIIPALEWFAPQFCLTVALHVLCQWAVFWYHGFVLDKGLFVKAVPTQLILCNNRQLFISHSQRRPGLFCKMGFCNTQMLEILNKDLFPKTCTQKWILQGSNEQSWSFVI